MTLRIRNFLPVIAMAGLAAGCATQTAPKAEPSAAQAPRGGNTSTAIGMLYEGRVAEARDTLVNVLKFHPDDRRAKSLLEQIDTEPQALLGQESFAYRVRAGDTLSSIAERYLGDPTLFFGLARYNGLQLPATLNPGASLRIPGRQKPAVQVARPAARPAKPAAQRPAPPPNVSAAAPERAASLRVAGLKQLNRGNVDQAVALLQQASRSDPSNALVKRDLERALRIKRTLQNAEGGA